MIQAILWDLDGTLIQSESHHMQIELETFNSLGAPLTEEMNQKYRGRTTIEQFTELKNQFNLPQPVEELIAFHTKKILAYARSVFPLTPHAKTVLQTLAKRYKQALVTSGEKEMVDIILDRFTIRNYFSAIVTAQDVTQGKPYPEPLLTAAKLLTVKPKNAIAVEDALNGIHAAKAAGMKVILKKHSQNTHVNASLADFVVDDLGEIPTILASL